MDDRTLLILVKVAGLCAIAALWPSIKLWMRSMGYRTEEEEGGPTPMRGVKVVSLTVAATLGAILIGSMF
jgi:hypothetical protein